MFVVHTVIKVLMTQGSPNLVKRLVLSLPFFFHFVELVLFSLELAEHNVLNVAKVLGLHVGNQSLHELLLVNLGIIKDVLDQLVIVFL